MEAKSKHNLEQLRLSNFFTGFCIMFGVTLAVFSYGEFETSLEKEPKVKFTSDVYLLDKKEKPLEVKPKEKPIVNETKVEVPSTSLENIKPVENQSQNNDIKPVLEGNKGDSSQFVTDEIVINPNPVVDYPDIEPDFPGGYNNWINWLSDNFVYPELDIEMGNQGIVYIQFIIEKDGSITDIEIIKGVSIGIDKEAKRLLRKSPKWIPGRVSGSEVRTRLKLPINFVIN